MREVTYKKFKENYLIRDFLDKNGQPKHTRFVKKYFYMFRNQLLEEFGPKLDLLYCSTPNCPYQTNNTHCGEPVIMELEHTNRITNDARHENLKSLCPICHYQTEGYKNRKSTIAEYYQTLLDLQK